MSDHILKFTKDYIWIRKNFIGFCIGIGILGTCACFCIAMIQLPSEFRRGIMPEIERQLMESKDLIKKTESSFDSKIAKVKKEAIESVSEKIKPSCLRGDK